MVTPHYLSMGRLFELQLVSFQCRTWVYQCTIVIIDNSKERMTAQLQVPVYLGMYLPLCVVYDSFKGESFITRARQPL